ncbi:hypothetical protein IWQ57_002074 [Coemansia nantahalensis]|nr:hypothetical protein IWQ57_002074 [Coemansia nantahalensis]
MRRGPNTNSIIDLYVGGAADDTAGDVGSARTSSGSRHGSIPPIGAGAGVDSALRPFSAIDTGFLSAVTALLPETPDTSAECSPGDPHGCVGWHGQRPPDGDLRASRELRADEELLAARLAEREQQFALTLALERRRHADEMARQRDAAQAQHGAELEAAHAVCDQLRALLEDCIATSEELVRQSESERDGLARELGSSTLERRRLEEQLGASHSRAAALESEQRAAQTQARAQTAENARLQELCATLLGDVATAEERNTRIKEHAQDTLSKANAEISRLQSQADQTQKAAAELEARVAKAEARARSLHIQLTSTKQQNADLLALCEGL